MKIVKNTIFLSIIVFLSIQSFTSAVYSQQIIDQAKKAILKFFDYESVALYSSFLGALTGMMGIPFRMPTLAPYPEYVHHFPENTDNANMRDTAIYYLPGWGEPFLIQSLGSDTYNHAHVYTIYFSEYRENRRFSNSIGQKADVIQVLKCLKETYDKERTSIILVGRSRGAHVLILLLLALTFNIENVLDEVNVDKVLQENLIKQIVQGSIIIGVPLLNMQKTLHYHFGKKVGHIMHTGYFPKLTKKLYDPHGWCAEKYLFNCNKLEQPNKPHFNIKLIYSPMDNITRNHSDIPSFVEQMNHFNGTSIHLIEIQGSHKGWAQQEALEKELHDLITKK